MRADRLISVLLMLQRTGKVTSGQVAEELEISPRTARRDLEALAVSGVPLYSQAGRNGGWFLLGESRTDLTGMNEPEARALVLTASAALGSDPLLQAALRKLVSALPEPFRKAAEAARTSIISDPEAWGSAGRQGDIERPSSFAPVSEAVLGGHQLQLRYQNAASELSNRTVNPLGLIEKRNRWYLVATDALDEATTRAFRLDRIQAASILDSPTVRPHGFDLRTAWVEINARFSTHALTVTSTGTATSADALPHLDRIMGARLSLGTTDPMGHTPVKIQSWSVEAAGRELAGFGSLVVIDEPPEVVDLLRSIGHELADAYPGITAPVAEPT